MSESAASSSASINESEIRALIDRWAQAVRNENRAAIRADHDPDILMFDVPPPFLSQGLDAYMATWETFFSAVEKPVTFHFTEVKITADDNVAFATAIGHCVDLSSGKRAPLDFRLTVGLQKIDSRWRIVHEHHSLPAV
jgi:uncharacterized protein (TIGR02246 family)